ncbi:hypothetical protein V565_290610, partial [Rhizoctonia solani 123E]
MVQERPTQSEFNAAAALELLNTEALLSVNLAVARFTHTVAPPASGDLYIAYNAANLFASTPVFKADYNLWLSIPVPSAPQLTTLREALATAICKSPTTQFSIAIVSGLHTVYAPTWVLNLWPRLRTLIQHSKAWLKASDLLEKCTGSDGTMQRLALELVSRLTSLPLDSPIPGFSYLQTSDLPDLLCNEWLSDEHINAGGEFINAHPSCKPNIRVLNSFFIISTGVVNQLLILINLPSHWAFIFVDVSLRTYSYFDTLAPAQISVPQTCIGLLHPRNPSPLICSSIATRVALLPSNMVAHAISGSNQFPMWTQATAAEHRLRWGIHFLHPSINLSGPIGPFTLDVNVEDLVEKGFNPAAPFDNFEAPLCPPDSGKPPVELSLRFPANTTRLKQSLLPFKRISHDEWHAQETKRLGAHQIEREEYQDKQQLLAIQETLTR